MPPQTKQQGFYFYSPHWIYSKRSLAAPGEPFKRDSLTWIPDDAESDFESACFPCLFESTAGEPGDLRVAFEFQRVPQQMTLVGVQNDATLLPVRRAGSWRPLAAAGNQTAETMLDGFAGEEGREVRYVRIVACAGCFVGLWMLGGAICPFKVGPGRGREA